LLWDVIKTEIRGISISHGTHIARENRDNEAQLIKELNDLETQLCENPTEETKTRYYALRMKLAELNDLKTKGLMVRSW